MERTAVAGPTVPEDRAFQTPVTGPRRALVRQGVEQDGVDDGEQSRGGADGKAERRKARLRPRLGRPLKRRSSVH
jgi:hypothetical protein